MMNTDFLWPLVIPLYLRVTPGFQHAFCDLFKVIVSDANSAEEGKPMNDKLTNQPTGQRFRSQIWTSL